MAYDYGLNLGAPFVGNFGVSSPTGYRKAPKTNLGRGSSRHHGTDYRTPAGTVALASMTGKVVRVAHDPKGYGHYVAICRDDGVCANYAHMGSIDVKPGQTVQMGQPIGKTGNSGNSSGAHLDYTVTKNGVSVRQDGSLFEPTGKSWLAGNGKVDSPAAPAAFVAPTQMAAAPAQTAPAQPATPVASGITTLSSIAPLTEAESGVVQQSALDPVGAVMALSTTLPDFFVPGDNPYG